MVNNLAAAHLSVGEQTQGDKVRARTGDIPVIRPVKDLSGLGFKVGVLYVRSRVIQEKTCSHCPFLRNVSAALSSRAYCYHRGPRIPVAQSGSQFVISRIPVP